MSPPSTRLFTRALPFLAFFLSGASSLVFQSIWSRLLHHVFGSSSVAISSVVSAFMGGLALGAWFFGRYADRIARPLRVYAIAEVGVGVCGLLIPLLIGTDGPLAGVNAWLRQTLDPSSGTFMVARFVCIVPVLIVPTTLMGATLPLLARFYVGRHAGQVDASVRIGSLYAVNTLGAVTGVFLAGFVLMPSVGVSTTNALAASTNFVLALVLLLMFRGEAQTDTSAPTESAAGADVEDRGRPAHPGWIRRLAAATFALSGVTSLLYEVVWSRALINTIGGSVYAFSLILMTFLTGIAGGSAIAAAVERRARMLLATAVAAGLLTALSLVPMGAAHGLPTFAWLLTGAVIAIVAQLAAAERERRTRTSLLGLADALNADATQASVHAPLFRLMAVPATCAVVGLLFASGRLANVCASVIGLDLLLLSLLLLLRDRPVWLLAALQGFIALASFNSDIWADGLSLTFAGAVAPLYDALSDSVDIVLALMLLMASLCVLPAALAMGAMFPATMRVWTSGGARVGREVGVVYTGNTVGSIIGAWLPGFLLMPTYGMQGTLHIGIAINLAVACVLGWAASRRRRLFGSIAAPAWVALALTLYAASVQADNPIAWNLSRMTLGAFRISLARDVLDEEAWGAPELVYYRDGLSTTVTVERWGRHYSLKNNGKVDASNGDDMPTQISVSGFPLLMHHAGPQDLDVAIVGFGSGVTVGAALQFPIKHVDVVELEDGVIEASRFFADVNHLDYRFERFPYVQMPRLRVFADDGRNFLAAATRKYDVIISEPSNPWLTGVSDLFTVDHFRVSKRRLAQDGVYCQWVQLYEMSPQNVKTIYRTFASQFEHVVVFSAEDLSSDTVLIGSDRPLAFDLQRVARAFANPTVAAELERAYLHSPQDVFARVLLASRQEVLDYAGPGPLNTDDNALIEFSAPRDLIGFERYKGYLRTFYTAAWPYGALSEVVSGFGDGAPGARAHAVQALSLLAHGRKAQAEVFAARALAMQRGGAAGRGNPLEHEVAVADLVVRGLARGEGAPPLQLDTPEAPAELSEGMVRQVGDAHANTRRYVRAGDWSAAFHALDGLPGPVRTSLGPQTRLLHAQLAVRAAFARPEGRERDVLLEPAVAELESIARTEPDFILAAPALYFALSRAHDGLSHFDKAVRNMRVYAEAQAAALVADDRATGRQWSIRDRPGSVDKSLRSPPAFGPMSTP